MKTLRNRRLRLSAILVLLLASLSAGCRQVPSGWAPVLEENPSRFLDERVERALAALEQAERDPARADEALALARRQLEVLRDYHLPLLEARERAYNAYRLHLLGRDDDAAAELDRIEALFEGMSVRHPDLARELEGPLETVVHARRALDSQGRPEEVRSRLERLAREILLLELKDDLVLHGTSLEGR